MHRCVQMLAVLYREGAHTIYRFAGLSSAQSIVILKPMSSICLVYSSRCCIYRFRHRVYRFKGVLTIVEHIKNANYVVNFLVLDNFFFHKMYFNILICCYRQIKWFYIANYAPILKIAI